LPDTAGFHDHQLHPENHKPAGFMALNASRNKRRLRRFGIGALLLMTVWWVMFRRVYFEEGMRVSLNGRGAAGAVTFVVKGPYGEPVPGVSVSVENTSGGGGSGMTDEQGVAVIPEHETEIVAVWIDGVYCVFRKIPVVDHVLRPDCAAGLTVVVRLEQQP